MRLVFPFLQVADAAPTEDAAFLVEDDGVGDQIVFLLQPFGFHQLADPRPEAHCLILEWTFATLVTDRTVKWVVEQDEAQVGLLHRLDLFRLGEDRHPFGHRQCTCRHQTAAARAFHFDHAHAATTHRIQLRVGAEDRNLHIDQSGGVHHQRSGGNRHLAVIDFQGYVIGHECSFLRVCTGTGKVISDW